MANLLGFNWYGFLIGGAIVLCIILSWFLLKYRGYNSDIVFDAALICIPLAIVGARAYYIIFDVIGGSHTLSYWFTDLHFLGFFKVGGEWKFEGLKGLAIFGGIIGATIGGAIIAAISSNKEPSKRMSFLQLADMFFIMIILGQAIGRWGNFANGEAYGSVITNPDLQWFPLAVLVDGVYYQATFFYESFFNFIGFGILAWFYFGKRRSYDGFNFSVYCIWYGTVRVIVEGMRSDSLMMGSIRVSQLLAGLIIAYGAGNILYHIYMAKKSGKKIFILRDKDSIGLDYYGYQKTIMHINAKKKARELAAQEAAAQNQKEFSYNDKANDKENNGNDEANGNDKAIDNGNVNERGINNAQNGKKEEIGKEGEK